MSVSPVVAVHPAGMVTDTAELDAVVGPEGAGDLAGIGLGVPAGVGLGRSVAGPAELLWPEFLALKMATAVPHAPSINTNPTTAPMTTAHDVRWTGVCGTPAAGV